MNLRKIFVALISIVSTVVLAGPTYTPAQLRQMVAAGKYPDQDSVTSRDVKESDFPACRAVAKSMIGQLADTYPTAIIVDTSIAYIAKAWTNDGVVMVACSEPDQKMVITQANYK